MQVVGFDVSCSTLGLKRIIYVGIEGGHIRIQSHSTERGVVLSLGARPEDPTFYLGAIMEYSSSHLFSKLFISSYRFCLSLVIFADLLQLPAQM